MTGAAGIPSSSAAPPSGAKQKITSKDEGDDLFGSNEASIFAEFLSFFEGEESVADSLPASGQDASQPDNQSEKKSNEKTDAPEDSATALQVEMTHNAWFGGEKADGLKEDVKQRPATVLIQKPDPESPDFETDNFPTPMPPLAMSDWFGSADRENGNLLYRLAPQDPPSERWVTKPQQEERAAPIHPLEIAESLANVELVPREASRAVMRSETVANPNSGSSKDQKSNPATKAKEPFDSNIKASLSALEAVLARDSSAAASDTIAEDDIAEASRNAIKEAGISSIRQETHYSLGLSQSPVLQIAQRLTHEMQIARSQFASQADQTGAPERGPIRVLHIQLDPPHLGPLTIRISLQNEMLNLQLETPKPETASLIQNDKDSLSKLLRSAGYMVDGLNIQVTPTERASGGQQSGFGAAFGQATGQQPGWRQPEGRAPNDGWSSSGREDRSSQGGRETTLPQAGKPRGRGVYL